MGGDRVLRIDMQVLEIGARFWRPGYFALTIAVLMAVGSLMPAEDAESLPGSDFAHHAFAYCLLSFFAVLAVKGRLISSIILLGILGFGIALEFIQPFFGRASDFNDVIANAAGVLFGFFAAVGFQYLIQCWDRRQSFNTVD